MFTAKASARYASKREGKKIWRVKWGRDKYVNFFFSQGYMYISQVMTW